MPLAACYSATLSLDKRISGVYALKHPRYGIIYIGKGKPIFRRIRSHYKATQGREKAAAWRQFFSFINSDITIHWYDVDHSDFFIGERYREALERILQIKYQPLFDIIYSEVGHKEVADFERRINDLFAKRRT
jgi:hypothetical protein